jgi:hypothetical protein
VVSLFGEQQQHQQPDHEQQQQQQSAGGSDTLSASVLLDRIFESICRPLKVRLRGGLGGGG